MEVELLKTLRGFSALSNEALCQIAPYISVRVVRAGETIFCQGEPSPYCFGVVTGEVIIQHVAKDSRFPPKVLGVIGPGYLFGESSLFEDSPRRAMATASKDGKLVVIRGIGLRDWGRENALEAQPLLMGLLEMSLERMHQTSLELAVLHGVGRLLGSDKSFNEQLAMVLDFLKGSLRGLDDIVFYQRNPYWDEFSPLMSLPALEDLPAIAIQHELVQKVSMAGSLQLFDPSKLRVHLQALSLPWENRSALGVVPLFDWEKGDDTLQGLLLLASAHCADAFTGGERLLLGSISLPLAEALSRQGRRDENQAQARLRQSKKTY